MGELYGTWFFQSALVQSFLGKFAKFTRGSGRLLELLHYELVFIFFFFLWEFWFQQNDFRMIRKVSLTATQVLKLLVDHEIVALMSERVVLIQIGLLLLLVISINFEIYLVFLFNAGSISVEVQRVSSLLHIYSNGNQLVLYCLSPRFLTTKN